MAAIGGIAAKFGGIAAKFNRLNVAVANTGKSSSGKASLSQKMQGIRSAPPGPQKPALGQAFTQPQSQPTFSQKLQQLGISSPPRQPPRPPTTTTTGQQPEPPDPPREGGRWKTIRDKFGSTLSGIAVPERPEPDHKEIKHDTWTAPPPVRGPRNEPAGAMEKLDEGLSTLGDKFKKIGETFNKWGGGEAVKAFKAERAGEVGSHLFGIGEKAGQQIGGPVGGLIEKFSKLGKIMAESLDKLRDWTRNLHESNMRFAEFSASMALVQAQTDIRRIELERERGERRAATAGRVSESMMNLEREVTPWEDAWANIKGELTAWGIDKLARILGEMNDVAREIPLIKALLGDKDKEIDIHNTWVNSVSDDYLNNLNRPRRFGP